MHRPETVTEMIVLEKKLLEFAIKDWEKMDNLGSSYSLQVQKDVCYLYTLKIHKFKFHKGVNKYIYSFILWYSCLLEITLKTRN